MPPLINPETCSRCGLCVESCPTDVFSRSQDGNVPEVRYADECWHCNSCVLDCPQSAIRLRIPLPAMMLYIPSGAGPDPGTETKA